MDLWDRIERILIISILVSFAIFSCYFHEPSKATHSVEIAMPDRDEGQYILDGYMYSDSLLLRYTQSDVECLQKNIYFEASNQTKLGQEYVGWVTVNRVNNKRFKNNICDVVADGRYKNGKLVRNKCHFSWRCDLKSDEPNLNKRLNMLAWSDAYITANYTLKHDLENPTVATHYHTLASSPDWRLYMTFLETVDYHHFYLET